MQVRACVVVLLGAMILTGCPSNEPEETAKDMQVVVDVLDSGSTDLGNADVDIPVDRVDTQPDADMQVVEDMADMSDMSEPLKCPDLPRCRRGYDYNDYCECVAPQDRGCENDSDCREGETCEVLPRSTGDRTVQVCVLDESTLTVEACPGLDTCQDNAGMLRAAAVSKIVTPQGFETATAEGLDGAYINFNPPLRKPELWNDCGYDGLCPGDDGYMMPDEGEGDGELQGMWIAGFSVGRAAQFCPEELIGCEGPECCVSKYAHDDLRVQIMVFEKGSTRVAFAVLDSVGYFHTYIDEIRRRVAEEADIDLLVMSSTHSHESPDTVGQWGPGTDAPVRTGRDRHYMKRIQDETVAGIKEAVANLAPATVEVAVIDVGEEGIKTLAMSDSRPPYIYDDNIPVVRVTDSMSGAPIGTMLSVGNHAEVLWSNNPYISSDYFHFVREYVSQGLDAVEENGEVRKPALAGLGGVTVMFAGAVGGLINPGHSSALDYADVEHREHGYAKADAVGQRIAMHILQQHNEGKFTLLEDTELRFATKRFLTPITNTLFLLAGFVINVFERDMYNAKHLGFVDFEPNFPHVMSQVAVVRLGPLSFFTAPGEVFPELLVGGYPGKPTAQNPVIGDVGEVRVSATCDINGLPPMNGEVGMFPCLVKADQENPPDWSLAPDPPYGYDLIPGEYPFFIGLGMDFLGYMVPSYDFEPNDAPGAHYEETNSASGEFVDDWLEGLNAVVNGLPE